jgi:glutamine amidotransferase
MIDALRHEVLDRGKPFLGLCLGMQFLADASEENGTHAGLGWIPGTVRRMRPSERQYKIPHMGWNTVAIRQPCPLFSDLPEAPVFYFVHAYHFDVAPEAASAVTTTCYHGVEFAASVRRDNIFGVQFHPEKSQRDGIKLIENFLALVHSRSWSRSA